MSVVPSQILYLEHGPSRLYAEAIQVMSTRQLCWSRPTLLIAGLPEDSASRRQSVIAEAAQHPSQSPLELYDLEGAPDLIWPLSPFHLAYDLDFFALLVQLKMNSDSTERPSGTAQLNDFIKSFWYSQRDSLPLTQV
ncbi:MAG: hypothetical protein AAFQ74_00085 [Cyanobacteria bacterium J06623_4]